MRTYRITHRTAYSYESDVSASYGRMRLLPRDLPWQRCVQSNVWLDPAPADHSEHVDLLEDQFSDLAVLLRNGTIAIHDDVIGDLSCVLGLLCGSFERFHHLVAPGVAIIGVGQRHDRRILAGKRRQGGTRQQYRGERGHSELHLFFSP